MVNQKIVFVLCDAQDTTSYFVVLLKYSSLYSVRKSSLTSPTIGRPW